jgi:predicted acylesterase/phospholipase RssA/CRP-like cAMP-binding protein
LELVHVKGGARLVERGQSDAPFILIVQGGLRASYRDRNGRRHVVFEFFRGATVGEGLVLSGRPSPLDLHAIRDSSLLRLSAEKFTVLATQHPELILTFARYATSRMIDLFGSTEFLSSFTRRADRIPRSITLVSTSQEDTRRMRGLLAEALSKSRVTTRVSLRDAPSALGREPEAPEGVADARFLGWLDDLDTRSDLLVFECEPADRSWMEFCVRQADRIMVLMGDGDRRSVRGEVDWWRAAKLEEPPAHLELAIVHGGSTELPRGGAAYAELPGVSRLHHVRKDVRDAERLARWLLDRPVGLVLGGGGALGIAHIGVLRALEEAGIPVDIIGGTSMGAIFAGGYARGWSAGSMMERVRHLFASRFALYDPTIPFSSLLAGRKLDRILERFFDDIDIADLWTPFFCVSTNISRARRQVHDSGNLRDAIRSSCSIPGLFPPFQAVRQLLVDGGLVDNLPLDVMAERSPGPIIAVDVYPYQRTKPETSPPSRRPVRNLARKLKLFASMMPGHPWLFDVLTKATLVGSQRTTELSLSTHPPALYLVPSLTNFRVLEWTAYEALFEAGHACAKHEIEKGALPRSLWEGPLPDSAP